MSKGMGSRLDATTEWAWVVIEEERRAYLAKLDRLRASRLAAKKNEPVQDTDVKAGRSRRARPRLVSQR